MRLVPKSQVRSREGQALRPRRKGVPGQVMVQDEVGRGVGGRRSRGSALPQLPGACTWGPDP